MGLVDIVKRLAVNTKDTFKLFAVEMPEYYMFSDFDLYSRLKVLKVDDKSSKKTKLLPRKDVRKLCTRRERIMLEKGYAKLARVPKYDPKKEKWVEEYHLFFSEEGAKRYEYLQEKANSIMAAILSSFPKR